jgi:hypothetical protein
MGIRGASRPGAALVLVGAAVLGSCPSASAFPRLMHARLAVAAHATPRLGRAWAAYQKGYGHAHPNTIFNGGDPTGVVQKIRWTGWGRPQAVGWGRAEYVWPGTAVADNGFTDGARVVAFHLGTCRGRRSYNAIEWYFPKYDEAFDARTYIDICNGKYHGVSHKTTNCADVPLADGSGTATEVQAISMSCAAARELIAVAPTTRYKYGGGRFRQADFRCGTMGSGTFDEALFDCVYRKRQFLYWVS